MLCPILLKSLDYSSVFVFQHIPHDLYMQSDKEAVFGIFTGTPLNTLSLSLSHTHAHTHTRYLSH